jgi:radical SAM protein with 4Fe4S-binding SPASM domain
MLKGDKLINPEIRIETTNACQGRCIICPREQMTRPVTTMCWGHFVSIIDQADRIGAKAVSLFGFGEPLLDRGLVEKLQFVTKMGLESHITTNGMALTMNKSRKLLRAGLKNLRFSVHAISPYDYQKVHRRIDWLSVFRNLGNFLMLNEKEGHPCKVHLSVIPMNGESVKVVRATWEQYVDYLEIWKPHNWGGKRDFRASIPKKATCGRPFRGPVQVQADGTVIPCCFLTNSEIVLGNTHDKTLKEILEDEPYERLREAHRTGNLKGFPCETCDQLNDQEDVLLYSSRDPERKTGVTSSCKLPVN